MQEISTVRTFLETQGINLLRGILVLVVGFFLIHWILKLLSKNDKYVHIEPTLKGFLDNLIRIGLYIVVILTAANVMGIPMTSIVTLVASAGVAVSLALQGALSNLVGGLMLLLLKPIAVNEYVKAGDTEGTVQIVGTFFTEFTTADNRHVSLPNSSLTNTAIVNYSREGTRRLDVTFGVSYDADIDHTVNTLREAVSMTGGILDEPAPIIKLTECGDSSLSFMIRVWCKAEDYWDVNWGLIEHGKRLLDREKIEIPYPQMDVHMR